MRFLDFFTLKAWYNVAQGKPGGRSRAGDALGYRFTQNAVESRIFHSIVTLPRPQHAEVYFGLGYRLANGDSLARPMMQTACRWAQAAMYLPGPAEPMEIARMTNWVSESPTNS